MRAAGKAWICVVMLVAGIALLLGLLYLLGLALVEGRPNLADRTPSGVAACSSEPRAGYQPMNPWSFTTRFFDPEALKKATDVEREAFWVARRHLMRQPRHDMLRWHLSSTALTVWITRHWRTAQIADAARKEDFCRTWSKRRVAR